MSEEKRERDEWYAYGSNRQEWMTDDQFECLKLLIDFYFGAHHMVTRRVKEFGKGIQYSERPSKLSTFDFDGLTRLVFMAHDRCVRVELAASGPGLVRLVLHKRHSREGRMSERHPTLETAVEMWRGSKD